MEGNVNISTKLKKEIIDTAEHMGSMGDFSLLTFVRCTNPIPIDIYLWGVDYAHQIALSPFDSKMFHQAWIKVKNSPASPAGTIA